MILDKCKNCKHYKSDERKVKAIFSSKPKIKRIRKGNCNAWGTVLGEYYNTKSNDWCEKYERKEERRTKNEFTD